MSGERLEPLLGGHSALLNQPGFPCPHQSPIPDHICNLPNAVTSEDTPSTLLLTTRPPLTNITPSTHRAKIQCRPIREDYFNFECARPSMEPDNR